MFGQSPNLELIDVFVNGELQRIGTQESVGLGTSDVCIRADSDPNGAIEFRYSVTSNDEILNLYTHNYFYVLVLLRSSKSLLENSYEPPINCVIRFTVKINLKITLYLTTLPLFFMKKTK